MTPPIETHRARDKEFAEISASILDLTTLVWPPAAGDAPDSQATLARWRDDQTAHFVIRDQNRVLAHALIFNREIFTAQGPMNVGALAAVCVHPDFRGRGWGESVVRAAFDFLPELGAEVSLFQTGVPSFYEKLGGRLVLNRFFNGDHPDNPFWDVCEMIYPASFPWPDGDIDLNGPGY